MTEDKKEERELKPCFCPHPKKTEMLGQIHEICGGVVIKK